MAGTFHTPTLASETIAYVGNFPIRNSMIMGWLAMAVLIIAAVIIRRRGLKLVPTGFQNFIEVIIDGLYSFYNTITQNPKETKKFFGVVSTIFIFVMLSNWMGILPGVGSVVVRHEQVASIAEHNGPAASPLFRPAYADVNMTMAIAMLSIFFTQFFGIQSLGFRQYAGKFFVNPLRNPIGTFVGLLELVSEFAKIISFTFRLFGNIFAGEVLLVVISFLAPFIAPLPFYGLELFVGFVQALVFALLTLVFMKMAVTAHH